MINKENNFEKDINVPSKEQIIIDGVNVYGCVQFIQEEGDCCNLGGSCKGWPNCYYKQLARKTQECEELLKENQQLRNSLSDSLMFKFTGQENETNRYRKALEEIKGIAVSTLGHVDFVGKRNREEIEQILLIISKAEGEGNK